MVRSFIAVDTVTEKLKSIASTVHNILIKDNVRVSLQDPNTLHITIKFLGEVSEERIEVIKKLLNKIACKKFTITAYRINAFPDLRRPRVIFIEVKDSPQLTEWHRSVEALMTSIGFPRETKAFKPHITVARVKSPSRYTTSTYLKLANIEFEEHILVDSLKLKKSTLTSRGAIYEDLHKVDFT